MKIKNESGRSMVEMLGVLAIVGVLSIGGLAGYTTAMNKYRATEIMNSISLTLVDAETQGQPVSYKNAYAGGDDGTMPAAIQSVITDVYVDPGRRMIGLVPNGDQGAIPCNGDREPCRTVANSLGTSQAFTGYSLGVLSSDANLPTADSAMTYDGGTLVEAAEEENDDGD